VLSAIPWITDSTTVQNIVIIAIVSNITSQIQIQVSSLTDSQRKNNVAKSLHLHHVPRADMLECSLEILLNDPYLKTCTFEYAAP
jgi:hypothetical protein